MPHPSLAVIVPAYNEEASIGECLSNLVGQIEHIDEIIIVDNNSTDSTSEIVSKYVSGYSAVRLIRETDKGIIPARNAGLNAASADILARIDADTFVAPSWAESIKLHFDANEDHAAITGTGEHYDAPRLPWWFQISSTVPKIVAIQARLRKQVPQANDRQWSESFGVYGGNMAIRRSVWLRIRDQLHNRPGIWEDCDINLALLKNNARMALVNDMHATISARRLMTPRKSYWEYTAKLPETFAINEMHREARWSWLDVWIRRIDYLLYWVPLRTFDPENSTYSLRRIAKSASNRPIP